MSTRTYTHSMSFITLFVCFERHVAKILHRNPHMSNTKSYQQMYCNSLVAVYLYNVSYDSRFLKAFSRKPVLFTWFDPELPHGRVAHHPGHSVGDHAAFVRKPVPVVPLVRPQRLVQCRLGPVPEVFIRSDLEAMSMQFFH